MSKTSKWVWSLFIWSIVMAIIVAAEYKDNFAGLAAAFAIWLTVLGIMRLVTEQEKSQETTETVPPPKNLPVKPEAKGKDFVILSKEGNPLPLAKWANETNPDVDLLTWYEIMHIVATNYSEDTIEELKELGKAEIMVDDMISAFGKDRTTRALERWGNSPLSWDACAKSNSSRQLEELEKVLLQTAANTEEGAEAKNAAGGEKPAKSKQ